MKTLQTFPLHFKPSPVAAILRAQELRETVTDVRSLVERPEPQAGEGEKSRDPVTEERQDTMIATNYMKHPEALRFQRELFSNGYHNQPRIMRLMECIFDQRPSAPAWWTAAKAKARALAKSVRLAIGDFFKELDVQQLSLDLEEPKLMNQSMQAVSLIPYTDRAGLTIQALDAPVYMSYCNNWHRVKYAWNKDAPYWGGFSQ